MSSYKKDTVDLLPRIDDNYDGDGDGADDDDDDDLILNVSSVSF